MPDKIKKPIYGSINVSLAVFWSRPNEEPIYKNLSVQAATNPAAWSGSLTIEDRLWLVDKVETTAIFGEPVVILNQQGDWSKVAAVSQRTQKNEQGYPGWVLTNQISRNPTYSTEQLNLPTAVVSVPETNLFEDSALTQNLGTLSYQTRLPILTENEAFLTVRLPGGNLGYLSRPDTKKTTELFFDNKKIVAEAQHYLNLKYIWGGTSSYGFDCSGLMFRLYQSQGLSIPRDASEQVGAGKPVLKENLQAGDLLFFAKDKSPNTIHHVGMYIGEGLMIHSPNSKSVIRIEPFEAGIYGKEYWGARRYCKN
jgi:cell wall-associated NlpC family hydrolase